MTDYSDLVARILDATRDFDKHAAAIACDHLIQRIASDAGPAPVVPLKKILAFLRNKRYFEMMEQVAAAAIESGQRDPQIRRQHAQGLIDRGKVTAAIEVLTALVAETAPDGPERNLSEHAEARGLLGRAHKQAYVNAVNRRTLVDAVEGVTASDAEYRARAHAYRTYLEIAVREYNAMYEADPDRHLWHGINTVACLCRASRDGIALEGYREPRDIAATILSTLEAVEPRQRMVWDLATAIEACVALDRLPEALDWLAMYASDERADGFEFGSTLRQLTEVWQLTSDSPPGNHVLPVLHAALLRREGGSVELASHRESGLALRQEQQGLEAVLGDARFLPYTWYLTGLQRCYAVGRIETKWGQPFGTGFLVRGRDLNPTLDGQSLLLTNAHVVNSDPAVRQRTPTAVAPEYARVRFEAREDGANVSMTCGINRVIWTSPPEELDASLLELDTNLTCDPPYPFASAPPVAGDDRVYIIGYPNGGTLSLSLQDNRLVDVILPKLRYREPTASGSSGSPVFNQQWELVAMHHAGSKHMPSLSGAGTVEANEGIAISAIVRALNAALAPGGMNGAVQNKSSTGA